MARVISKNTVRKKMRDGYYDVGVSGHMEEKIRDKYVDSPVHRKSYAEIVQFGILVESNCDHQIR